MNSLLADLLNAMLLSGVITACVWFLLRFAGRDSWNARTREAVWWLALFATVMAPLLPFASSSIHHPQSQFSTVAVRAPSGAARFGEVQLTRVEGTNVAEARLHDPVLLIPAGRWASLIVVVWLLASLAMLVRLVVSYIRLGRLKARAIEAPMELVAKVDAWMNNFQKPRRVHVLISTEIATPFASGPHCPAVVIPQTMFTEIDSAELDQICLHEVAHLGRHDDYWLALQRIIQALFVFHPVVAWITARIQLEREIACDDFVVNMTREPRAYALCLVRAAELSAATPGRFATPIANGRSQLETRLNLLLNETRNRARLLLKIRLAGILAGLAALLFMMVVQAPGFLVLAVAQPELIMTGRFMVTDYLVSWNTQPAFSPTGESIAFHAELGGGGGIFIMNATGESMTHKIINFGFNPAWSPDGKQLVVAEENVVNSDENCGDNPHRYTTSSLWRVSVATGEKVKLFDGDAVQPQWSPHGLRIVYWTQYQGQRGIWTIRADGTDPIPLTIGASDWSPAWAANGEAIYFCSDRGGSSNIWRIPVNEYSGRATGVPGRP